MVDAYSLAVVLLSSIAMAALGGWFVFGRRHETNLSTVEARIRELEGRSGATYKKIDNVDRHFLTLAQRLETSLNQLTERVTALEADLAATTGLSGKSEVEYFRKELKRLSRVNRAIYDELSTILKYINSKQRSADGLRLALEQTTDLED